jgi:thiol:disulfide interchange protein
MWHLRRTLALAAALLIPVTFAEAAATAPAPRERPALPGFDWNDSEIAWRPLVAGLREARRTRKPVCVVIFATWCPYCRKYTGVFHDPRVVQAARGLVMIRVDADRDPKAAARYVPDGDYVPRTLFLAPDGTPDLDIHTSSADRQYAYSPSDPTHVLDAMRTAARQLP